MITPVQAARRAILDERFVAREQLNEDAYRTLIARLEAALAKERERVGEPHS